MRKILTALGLILVAGLLPSWGEGEVSGRCEESGNQAIVCGEGSWNEDEAPMTWPEDPAKPTPTPTPTPTPKPSPAAEMLPKPPAQLRFKILASGELEFVSTDKVWSSQILGRRGKGSKASGSFWTEMSTRNSPPSLIRGVALELRPGRVAELHVSVKTLTGGTREAPTYRTTAARHRGLWTSTAGKQVTGEITFRAKRSTDWKGFCVPCSKRGPYTEDVGRCTSGGEGCRTRTASGQFVFCDPCGRRLDCCVWCGLALSD